MDIAGQIWMEGYKPVSDIEVSQLLKYYGELERDEERQLNLIKQEIALLEAEGKEIQRKAEMYKAKVLGLVGEYVLNEVDEEDKKETTTQIKYKIPRGEIIINKQTRTLAKPSKEDEPILSEKYPTFTKKEPVFLWGEFKKKLELRDDGKVVNKEDGTIVDNVPVIENPMTYSIKLKM